MTPEEEAAAKAAAEAKLPEEFRGKSAEELSKLILAERQSKDDLAKNMGERLQEINQRIAGLNKTNEPVKVEEKVDWFNNPELAAQKLVDQKVAPYANAFLNAEETRQLTEVRKLDHYGEFESEIKQVMSAAHPLQKATPGFAQAAYDYVIGRNKDKVFKIETEAAAKKQEFVETGSSATARKADKIELSEDERKVAEASSMPPEEWAKWRDKPDEARTAGRKA
jgi:hypothetical protein